MKTISHIMFLFINLMTFSAHAQDSVADTHEKYIYNAENGQAEAQFNLGSMYSKGNGVNYDANEAVKWLRKAAEQGHVGAQFDLGLRHISGEGVPVDYVQAYMWLIIASSQGNESIIRSRNNMTTMMSHTGILQAQELVRNWKPKIDRQLIENNQKQSSSDQADDHHARKPVQSECDGVYERYLAESRQGNLKAQIALGKMYAAGQCVQQNDKEAVKWFLSVATHQTNVEAQYNLGVMYENGRDVPQSYEEAAEWYRKAANQQH